MWRWVVAAIVYFAAGFFVWRKMREEYEEEEILKLVMILGAAVFAGAAWARTWGAVGAGLVAMGWWCRRKDWNFWEWLDTAGPVGLAAGVFVTLNWVWSAGIAGVWAVGRWYRRWKWYKSGRPGLVGLVAILFLALGETMVANRVDYNLYLGVWAAVAVLVAIYLRSEVKLITKWRKQIEKA